MEKINDVRLLKEIIINASNIVFFGGAGISTESGLPDFRSSTGIYNQPHKFSPEKLLSHNFFFNQPKLFWDFYKKNIVNISVKPNAGHYFLTELEATGKLKAIITQNIDGLHQEANSKNVIELHGSIYKNHCTKCNKSFGLEYIRKTKGTIRCDECNALVKPDIILYNESLDSELLDKAIKYITDSDLLIIAGTSLNVYPAASLVKYAKNKLLINLTRSSLDIYHDYVFYGKFGKTCELINKL